MYAVGSLDVPEGQHVLARAGRMFGVGTENGISPGDVYGAGGDYCCALVHIVPPATRSAGSRPRRSSLTERRSDRPQTACCAGSVFGASETRVEAFGEASSRICWMRSCGGMRTTIGATPCMPRWR